MSSLFCCSAKEEDDENEGEIKIKKKLLVERSRTSDNIFEELKKRRLVPAISFMFLHRALPFTPPSPPPL